MCVCSQEGSVYVLTSRQEANCKREARRERIRKRENNLGGCQTEEWLKMRRRVIKSFLSLKESEWERKMKRTTAWTRYWMEKEAPTTNCWIAQKNAPEQTANRELSRAPSRPSLSKWILFGTGQKILSSTKYLILVLWNLSHCPAAELEKDSVV